MKGVAHVSLSCLVLAACHGKELTQPEPDPDPTHQLEIFSGDAQADTVARPLDAPLVVRLLDAAGQPIVGAKVGWRVVSGDGQLGAITETGTDGTSHASYVLGPLAGVQSVAAQASELGGKAAFFTLHAAADAPASLARRTGNLQTGEVNGRLASPLQVRLGDRHGNPIAGATIAWSAAPGVSLDSPTSVTDRSGVASVAGTLGNELGAHQVTASLPGDPPLQVDFEVRALVPVPVASQILMPTNYVSAHDSFIRDGIAFLAAWDDGLVIYDVGNGIRGGTPEQPVKTSRIETVPSRGASPSVHNAWWMWNPATGERRYVFVGEEGTLNPPISSEGDVHVVDVSDLAAPREVTRYRLPGAGSHYFWLDEARQILFVAYYNGGVVALDVSGTLEGDLANREIARIAPGGPGQTFVYGVQGENGSLYASDMFSGVWQLRLGASGFTVEGGGFNLPTDGRRMGSELAVGNGVLYSGTRIDLTRRNPLLIWDISGTGAPALVDSLFVAPLTDAILDVKVSPDRRLLMVSTAGEEPGLYFFSLADPRRPQLVARRLAPIIESIDFHTANFAEINGRLYVLAAQDPPTFKYLLLDLGPITERL